jgi:hypothetical protein
LAARRHGGKDDARAQQRFHVNPQMSNGARRAGRKAVVVRDGSINLVSSKTAALVPAKIRADVAEQIHGINSLILKILLV